MFNPQYVRWAVRNFCTDGKWKSANTTSRAALAWERMHVMDSGELISFRRTLRKCKRGAVSMTHTVPWIKPGYWME